MLSLFAELGWISVLLFWPVSISLPLSPLCLSQLRRELDRVVTKESRARDELDRAREQLHFHRSEVQRLQKEMSRIPEMRRSRGWLPDSNKYSDRGLAVPAVLCSFRPKINQRSREIMGESNQRQLVGSEAVADFMRRMENDSRVRTQNLKELKNRVGL